jgi:hypothetical protein
VAAPLSFFAQPVFQLLVTMLEDDVGICRRRAVPSAKAEFRAFLASLPNMGDSTPLIREDRER